MVRCDYERPKGTIERGIYMKILHLASITRNLVDDQLRRMRQDYFFEKDEEIKAYLLEDIKYWENLNNEIMEFINGGCKE